MAYIWHPTVREVAQATFVARPHDSPPDLGSLDLPPSDPILTLPEVCRGVLNRAVDGPGTVHRTAHHTTAHVRPTHMSFLSEGRTQRPGLPKEEITASGRINRIREPIE